MIPLNYHHLYYFWITAKTGSITKAGEELLLAQPTLSLQLKQLEKSFGKSLLQRRRDGVGLTPDGQKTFEYCERIFTQGDALLRALREGRSQDAPGLRVGVATAVSRQVILRFLDTVGERAPSVLATIFSANEAEINSRLLRHTLDVALAPADLSTMLGRDFRGKLIAEIPVSFVATPKFKKSFKSFPPQGQALPMLLRSPENPLRKEIEGWLSRKRAKVHVVAETEDGYLLRVLAAQGRGVAGLNDLAYRDNLREGVLVPLNSAPTGIKEHVWLISAVHPHPDAALAELVESLMANWRVKA